MAKTKAFSYLRVSGKGQATDDRDGYPRQRATIAAFTRKAGLVLADEYKDAATGGKENAITPLDDALDGRPEFERMVADMLGNGVRAVVVERLDRFARAYVLQEQFVLYLASHGIDLYSADTAENVTASMLADPMKKALVQMRGVFSELDKNVTVRKLRRGRDDLSDKLGRRCEGRKRFGTRPGEADTLAMMRQLYRKPRGGVRRSYRQIADALNTAGRTTRQGGLWQAATVRGIVLRESR